jgi:ATP-dependent DNA ligase
VIVNNLKELYAQYQSFVDDGYEGAMYRTLGAPYSHSRSSELLKVKPEDSSEAVVKKIMEGTGNWSGAAKTATLDWNGIEFDATFKGQYGELQKILKNPSEFLNNRVTFLYNGLTGLNKPNFARIDIANCFKT